MNRHGPSGYRYLLALAGAAVFWERLWPRLWPAAGIAGVFVSLALLDLLPRLPGWLHALVLAAFAGALTVALGRGAAGLRRVGRAAARRRLERDSGLRHRPLSALEDRLAAGAAALWQAHLERMADAVRDLRVRLPAPGLARHDPYGLRAVVVLGLVIGSAAAGAEAPQRLERALVPSIGSVAGAPPRVQMWITPPAYTGRPPLFLEDTAPAPPETVEAPAGSALLVRIEGAVTEPRLVVGGATVDFTAIGPDAHRAEIAIDRGDRLTVETAAGELASWPLRVIPDAPPRISFASPPTATERAYLRLEYVAEDDYGIAALGAVIERPGSAPPAAIRLELPVPRARSATAVVTRDLTAHPWAGQEVRIRLRAEDQRGQGADSEAVDLVLPQRTFNHPVARAIIAARKTLFSPSPGVRREVAGRLAAIAAAPEAFDDDTVVYLALAVAGARLTHDRGSDAIPSVGKLLWDTALHLEGGKLTIAEQALKRAREKLEEALREGADREQVERLSDELQRALDRYLAELGRRLERLGAIDDAFDRDLRVLVGEDLRRMIEEARRLALDGAVDAARRLLSELDRLIDGIRSALRPGIVPEDVAEARRILKALREVTGRQRQLLDRTFRGLQEKRPEEGRERPSADAEGAQAQEALRRRLGESMLDLDAMLGGIPQSLGGAERAMRGAAESLMMGSTEAAMEAQGEALEQLRRAMREAAGQLARKLGGLEGMVAGRRGGEAGRDPFGRGPIGPFIDGSTLIPDDIEIRRARRLLEELRHRAGQRRRPKPELDYIERLLRRF